MNYPVSAPAVPTLATAPTLPTAQSAAGRIAITDGMIGSDLRAVQDDVAVTVVDWQVVHAWRPGDPDFVGALTIVNGQGGQLATATWSDPTDEAADRALVEVGWRRTGPWEADWLGRRSAAVNHPKTISQQAIR